MRARDLMIQPISPDDVSKQKLQYLPEEVILAVNEAIAECWNGVESTIKQKNLIDKILLKMPELSRQEVFDKHYLEIEDIYREAGWKVRYDKPGYNESYDAYFEFSKERK
jgi:hypothetical protein